MPLQWLTLVNRRCVASVCKEVIFLTCVLVPVNSDSPILFWEEYCVILIPSRFVRGINYPLNTQRPITQTIKVQGVAFSGSHSNTIGFHGSEVDLKQACFSYNDFLRPVI